MRKLSAIFCLLMLATAASVSAEDNAEKTKWYDRLDFSGDLRLRYEGFQWDTHFDEGARHRFRYRLRAGLTADVTDTLTVGAQLRSGNPNNPISDNQSFDSGLNKGEFSIAQAYVDWQATQAFGVIVGKFSPKKRWSASDLQWDDDLTVEGAMQSFDWTPDGFLKSLDVNVYQFVLNESSDSADAYLFGGQIVPKFALGEKNTLTVGLTYDTISNPDAVAALYFKGKLDIDSGYVTNFIDPLTGKLVSDFDIGNVFVEWKNKSSKRWPIKLTLYYYKNFGANDGSGEILPVDGDDPTLVTGNPADNDTAFFGRIQVGDYKKPGQVAVRLSRYDAEPDSMFFAWSQSDSRRSSNVDGYRVDFRVGLPKKTHVSVTWYQTDWALGADTTMDRWQADFVAKF